MAYKSDIEILEDYINSLKYEILKRDLTLKDLTKQVIAEVDNKSVNDMQKAELQIKAELTFLNRMLLMCIDEYDKKQTKIEK